MKQEIRAEAITTAVLCSKTPVTLAQVESHMKKFKGRPKEAQDHVATDVCNCTTVSSVKAEMDCFKVFVRATERLVTLAGNKNMRNMRIILDETLQQAKLLGGFEQEMDRIKKEAEAKEAEKLAAKEKKKKGKGKGKGKDKDKDKVKVKEE